MKKNVFHSPSLGEVTLPELMHEISKFIDEEPSYFYRLVIGSDSQVKKANGKSECDYVTAIVVHRQGAGARYFWNKEKVFRAPILREKIYNETMRSLSTAHELVPSLRKIVSPSKYDLEIHIDVGALGPTRDMIKEVVGMVTGNGFVAKTKPDGWAASSVADKHT